MSDMYLCVKLQAMQPTTKMKIKTALLIASIFLTIAVIVDIWLDIQMYGPFAGGAFALYIQAVNGMRKKELPQQEQQ